MHKKEETFSFGRRERLKSKIVINRLFDRNNSDVQSVVFFPFKGLFLSDQAETDAYPEVLISVPKRHFKRAVDRNRIKRLIRESYRIQKVRFKKKSYLAIIYIGKIMPESKITQMRVEQIITHFDNIVNK